MVTSEYCRENFKRNTKDSISFWSAGKDTVYNHVLFSKKHRLDSIKQVLKTQYNFKNDIDKVIFVGYDNGEKSVEKNEKKKELVPPIIISSKNKGDSNNRTIFMYAIAIGLSFLLTILAYMFFLKRSKRINYV